MLSTFRFIEQELADKEKKTGQIEFISPVKGEKWIIGQKNIIKLSKGVPDGITGVIQIIDSNGEFVGYPGYDGCYVNAGLESFEWNTELLIHSCGAGEINKERKMQPGEYKLILTSKFKITDPPILAESDYFSIMK